MVPVRTSLQAKEKRTISMVDLTNITISKEPIPPLQCSQPLILVAPSFA